jgi:hypothetical protein
MCFVYLSRGHTGLRRTTCVFHLCSRLEAHARAGGLRAWPDEGLYTLHVSIGLYRSAALF